MKKIEKEFEQVNAFVNRRWEQTVGFVNCQMLLTGWTVGAFVSARLKSSAWGSGTVDALVDYLKTRNPKLRGYGRRNIYNMVLFYDTYSAAELKGVYERLKLGEFVQIPSAQTAQSGIVQTASAQLPSIGIILCPSAESSEVSYTLCRSMSPMMVAEYQRLLVPQDVMKKSLDEYCAFLKREEFCK